MCMIDTADLFTVHVRERRTARKRRRCDECRIWIEPGERYEHARGLLDGRWSVYATCEACIDGPCAWLMDQCGGWLYHGVWEDLDEHWEERRGGGIETEAAVELGWHMIRMRRRIRAAQSGKTTCE